MKTKEFDFYQALDDMMKEDDLLTPYIGDGSIKEIVHTCFEEHCGYDEAERIIALQNKSW